MARRVLALGCIPALLAIGVAWSWSAAALLAFCLVVAFAVMISASVGGDWIADASRRRFDRDD
jgi:uncharacterized membrane protein YphA (DoxX/SURF4 family)